MSSNQETMRTSIKTATATLADSKQTAIAAAVTTINASGCDAGYKRGDPTNNATYVAAVKSAAAALNDARQAALMAHLGAIIVAKDLLRSQGEIPF